MTRVSFSGQEVSLGLEAKLNENICCRFIHPTMSKWVVFWAVKVSGNWRVIFKDGDAFKVNYLDYH